MTDPKAKNKGFFEKKVEEVVGKAIDKVADKFMDPILNCIKEFCTEFSDYLADFDEHVNQLELACPGLTATGNRLRQEVEIAFLNSSNMEKSTKVVQWYEEEKMTAAEAANLVEQGRREDGRCCLWKCFGRLCYGKKVVKCLKRLKDVKDEGDKLISDRKFLEQGAPDGEELLSSFEDKFRELTKAIIRIESLKEEVKHRSGASGAHGIKSWLKLVDLELGEGNSLTSKKEEQVKKFRNLGSGSCSDIQRDVKSCTERILEHHRDGESYLVALTAGPSYSS